MRTSTILHKPSGSRIRYKFLSGDDSDWSIDQNYSTAAGKIRNAHGLSQQLAGLFLAKGIHLPKTGGKKLRGATGQDRPASDSEAPASHNTARSEPGPTAGAAGVAPQSTQGLQLTRGADGKFRLEGKTAAQVTGPADEALMPGKRRPGGALTPLQLQAARATKPPGRSTTGDLQDSAETPEPKRKPPGQPTSPCDTSSGCVRSRPEPQSTEKCAAPARARVPEHAQSAGPPKATKFSHPRAPQRSSRRRSDRHGRNVHSSVRSNVRSHVRSHGSSRSCSRSRSCSPSADAPARRSLLVPLSEVEVHGASAKSKATPPPPVRTSPQRAPDGPVHHGHVDDSRSLDEDADSFVGDSCPSDEYAEEEHNEDFQDAGWGKRLF